MTVQRKSKMRTKNKTKCYCHYLPLNQKYRRIFCGLADVNDNLLD